MRFGEWLHVSEKFSNVFTEKNSSGPTWLKPMSFKGQLY